MQEKTRCKPLIQEETAFFSIRLYRFVLANFTFLPRIQHNILYCIVSNCCGGVCVVAVRTLVCYDARNFRMFV